MPRKRTPEEQSVIDLVARSQGREWAEAHAELILDQARALGELPLASPPGEPDSRVRLYLARFPTLPTVAPRKELE